MTPKQFWYDDPDDLWAYVSAYEEKMKEMIEYDNVKAYNQGVYFLLALKDSLQFGRSYKKIFPTKPLPTANKSKVQLSQEEYEEIRKIQLKNLVERFNSTTKSKK